MLEVVDTNINSFASVPPTADYLQSILSELQALREEVTQLRQDNEDLKATVISQNDRIATLEKDRDIQTENGLIQLRLINDLREAIRKEPGSVLQKDRADILRALLAANNGKLLAKEARKKMHLGENRFSELLKRCDFIEVKPLHSDKRKLVIILKSELLPRK